MLNQPAKMLGIMLHCLPNFDFGSKELRAPNWHGFFYAPSRPEQAWMVPETTPPWPKPKKQAKRLPDVIRDSFATHLLGEGYDIRTLQELWGHRIAQTTMINTHVLTRGPSAVPSPVNGFCSIGKIGGSA